MVLFVAPLAEQLAQITRAPDDCLLNRGLAESLAISRTKSAPERHPPAYWDNMLQAQDVPASPIDLQQRRVHLCMRLCPQKRFFERFRVRIFEDILDPDRVIAH